MAVKRNKKKIISWVLLLGGIFLTASSFARSAVQSFASQIEYSFGKAKFEWSFSDLNKLNINIPVRIKNKTSVSLSLTSFNGAAFYDGEKISDLSANPVSIGAGKSNLTTLFAQLNITDAISDLLTIIQNDSNFPKQIQIEGRMIIGSFTVPFSEEVEFINLF